ncbi:MAG: DUF397 domain-containing protein [bacterium]
MKKNIGTNNKAFPVKDTDFVKSSYSQPGATITCVQIARKSRGVAVRDSKDPTKTTLFFNHDEWKAFLAGARAGEFDPKTA